MIACIYLRHFAITRYQLEYALSPGIPLVLVDRGTVYAASPRAEQHGIIRTLPERQARCLCADAIFAPAALHKDAELLAYLLNVLRQETHHIEIVPSPHVPYFLIEIPVSTRPAQIEFARTLGRTVRTLTHQTPAIAISPTPFTAQTVAITTPKGYVRFIDKERVVATLAPHPLTLLPLSQATREYLYGVGIRTVGAFAALSAERIAAQFGQEGKRAHEMARGVDTTPIRPWVAPPASMVFAEEGEQLTFLPSLTTADPSTPETHPFLVPRR